MKQRKKRLVLTEINHLKDELPWTMGLAGLARLAAWETKNILGISKSEFIEKIIGWVIEIQKSNPSENLDKSRIRDICKKNIKTEIESAEVAKIYDKKITQDLDGNKLLISPMEAQRRIRCFSEEFLNKEFDVFMSLLPNRLINEYLRSFFDRISLKSEWNVFGLSNDFETAMDIKYMYHDTLLYSHATSQVIAIELKFDTELSKNQILKYAFMLADLESQGKISTDCCHDMLIISHNLSKSMKNPPKSKDGLIGISLAQINDPKKTHFPKKPNGKEMRQRVDDLVPRTKEILQNMHISFTSWQQLGMYFSNALNEIEKTNENETLRKLIKGFLGTLTTKFSHQDNSFLYDPENRYDKK